MSSLSNRLSNLEPTFRELNREQRETLWRGRIRRRSGFALPLRVSSPSIATSDTVRIASPGGGRRDRVSYNYSGGRERAVAILVRCSSLSAATTFSSSSNNSLLSTALFLTTASNNGRGWEEEDLGEKVWFFLLLLLLSSCNIVTVNFWF